MHPFATCTEHLLAELERIDLLIRLSVCRARQIKKTDDRFEGLYISEAEVEELLRAPAGLPRWAMADSPRPDAPSTSLGHFGKLIAARKAGSTARGIRLRLDDLAGLFGLDAFDLDVVLVCLAPETDSRYGRMFAYLQDDVGRRRPSVDVVLNLLSPSFEAKLQAQARFGPAAPLVRNRLVELFDDAAHPRPTLLRKLLKLDDRITRFLFGADDVDAALRRHARCVPCAPGGGGLEEVSGEIVRRLEVAASQRAGASLLVHLRGPRGAGKQAAARALCGRLGLGLLVVDGEGLVGAKNADIDSLLLLAAREARLQGAALYWDGFDALLADDRRPARDALIGELAGRVPVSFLAGTMPWEPPALAPDCVLLGVSLPRPDYGERLSIWTQSLGEDVTEALAAELPSVAAKFRFTGGEIREAAAAAQARARLREGSAGLTAEDVYASCRARSSLHLGELGRKIQLHYAWNDIVLPEDTMAQLREICGQVKHRGRVHDEWGFGAKLSIGKGLHVLFSGPSGTGKTMAAEIMAGELALELYKIDLSGVVSKYIGETEKNLARIFDAAENSNAILFFDEADALFGKRSEVKDAHDRYANIETSYLLQRIEEYEGMTILATNLRGNMDDAFVRRMAFVVPFPFPEEAERLRIWTSVWPAATPRADLDLAFMARQFKLAGGNIKNIALGAAFLAAAGGGEVNMEHLIRATKREMQKMGKSSVAGEFGAYAGLLEG